MRPLFFGLMFMFSGIVHANTSCTIPENVTCMAHAFCTEQNRLPLFSIDSLPFDTISGIIYINYVRKDEWVYTLNDVLFWGDDTASLPFQIADLASNDNIASLFLSCDTIFKMISFKNSNSLYDTKYFRHELKQDFHYGGDLYYKNNYDSLVVCYKITYRGAFVNHFHCGLDAFWTRVRYHYPFFISIDLIDATSISRKDRKRLGLSKYKKRKFGIGSNSDLW